MKGNKKILVVAVLLLLVAVSYTTYAIYKTSVAADATAQAAAWNVALKDGSDEITSTTDIVFTTGNCTGAASGHVAPDRMAPGLTCTKTITLDARGTEVDVAYTVTAGTATLTDAATGASLSDAGFTVTLTGTSTGKILYDAADANKTVNLTLTAAWTGTDDDTTKNPADVKLSGATITVPVTLTAAQSFGS